MKDYYFYLLYTRNLRGACNFVGKHKEYVKAIEVAMKEWEEQTCIRFKKATKEANYVEFEYGDG